MQQTLKRILPAKVRRLLRPLAIQYQRATEVPLQRKLFGNFIAPGDLVFDIGANSGRMTELFLSLGARVIAVEPQPRVFSSLEKKHGHNKRVTALCTGLSDKPGIEKLNICGDVDEVSSFVPEWEERHHAAKWSDSESVTMHTLDELIRRYGLPAYCKIDVEGYEPKVLAGLTIPISYLSFEIHTHDRPAALECFRLLSNLGRYKFNFAPHENQALQIPGWHGFESLLDWIDVKGWMSGDIFCKLQ